MKAITFVSMMLLAISGATEQSMTGGSVDAAAPSSEATQANLATQRICMRCLFGG